jgi:rod shape-determining protein MreD
MIYAYYFFVCFFLILLQTTVVPKLPPFAQFFDLLIPFIIYLGLRRPGKENLPIIIVLGVIADNLSGTPFLYFVSVYLWLYLFIRLTTNFLQVNTHLRMACTVAACVLFENLFIAGGLALSGQQPPIAPSIMVNIVIQTAWAFFVGPVFLLIIEWIHSRAPCFC